MDRLANAFCLALCAGIIASGEIIDRIAIAVANQVITESQIDDEIRVTAFLNREKLDLSAETKKEAAARLIEQALIKHEMDTSRYPLPALSDASEPFRNVKSMYSSDAEFLAALDTYGISADVLTRRLWWQLTLLRFIDYRFRPGIQIPAAEVQSYYRQQVSEWRQKGTQAIPTFEESRDQIEEILTQRQIDKALDQWINDTRNQVTINYLDPALNSVPQTSAPQK